MPDVVRPVAEKARGDTPAIEGAVITTTSLRRTREISSPINGAHVTTLVCATPDEVSVTVARGREAQRDWAQRSLTERIHIVRAAAVRLVAAAPELAALQEREMGQPTELGIGSILAAAEEWQEMATLATTYPFADVLTEDAEWSVRNLKVPLGVVAVITPWNFPVAVAAGAIGPALLAGNSVVVKPSERAFTSVARMVEALDLPDGVLSVVLGDAETGADLVADPRVALVLHTGSVTAGRRIASAAGARGARVGLELGGKDPVVIDADVPPEWAAKVVANGAFLNTGQLCISMERIYVHRAVAQVFIDALVDEARSATAGLGSMVDDAQREIVHRHVESATRSGARVLTGGEIPAGPGCYYPATVLVDVAEDMPVMSEETFGPIAPVRIVDSFSEGVALAAASEYGLTATLLTGTPAHAALADRLPAAIVWVNEWQGGAPGMVFEPAGSSGLSKLGAHASFDRVTRAMAVAATRPPWIPAPSASNTL
ncbi:MAG: aldehyde dehydrogenase family protein [Marmoricola sp.]